MDEIFRHGKPMDWDELLFAVPVVGHDFEILIRLGDLIMFRGPMGSIHRNGDEVFFRPMWVGIRRREQEPRIMDKGDGLNSPSVHLMHSEPRRLDGGAILIVASQTPWFLIHPQGDNITLSDVFGHEARA